MTCIITAVRIFCSLTVLLGVLALISILGIFYVFKRWPQARPMLILGLGWFLAALLPVLNIAPLINEYSFILTPEHFLYLPIVGYFDHGGCRVPIIF